MKKATLLVLAAFMSVIAFAQQVQSQHKAINYGQLKSRTSANTTVSKTQMVMPTAPMVSNKVQLSQHPSYSRAARHSAAAPAMKNFRTAKVNAPALMKEVLSKKANVELTGLAPTKSLTRFAPRKAGQLKEAYNATGIEIGQDEKTGEGIETPIEWTMTPVVGVDEETKEESPFFLNLIPVPDELSELYKDGIPYEYSTDGETVTIMPQTLARMEYKETADSDPSYLYLIFFNATSVDGSATYTLKESGSLKSSDGASQSFVIAMFTVDTFSAENFKDTYRGYVKYVESIKYRYDGQPELEDINVAREYTGMGTNYDTKANDTWTMVMGTKNEDGVEKNVIVDIIPSPFQDDEDSYIALDYEMEDETVVVIPAQLVGYAKDNNGNKVYIYLHSGISDDGSIRLLIDEEGHLATESKNEMILYGYWAVETPTFDEDDYDENFLGRLEMYSNLRFLLSDEIPAPNVMFEPSDLVLYTGLSDDAYSFQSQHVLYPAFANVGFKNLTTDMADSWSWKVFDPEFDEELEDYVDGELLAESTDKDFQFTTTGGTILRPIQLKGSYKEAESEPFTDSEDDAILYAGADCSNWIFAVEEGEDPMSSPILSRGNPKKDIAYYQGMGTSDGIHTYILYQGKPAKPLFITGVNMQVVEFNATEDFELTCKLQKVTRTDDGSITLGDVIAESAVDTENIETSDWGLTRLNWNSFYALDEGGFETVFDYIFIEDEFAIVIEGWDNGTFEAYPFTDQGLDNGLPSIHVIPTGETEYNGRAFWSFYGNFFVGYTNAIAGYLHTEDKTNLTFGKDGGEATIHVDPMLFTVNTEDENEPECLLEIESITIDGEPAEMEDLEGITATIENFEPTEEIEGGQKYYDNIDYDLVIKAEPLTDGKSRNIQIVFFQPGARLKVNISQQSGDTPIVKGDANGDGVVDVADISAVISVMAGGDPTPAADVNGDGSVDVADISAIISIMASTN